MALRPNVPVVHFNQEFMAINGRVIIGGFVAAINDIRLDKIVGLCDIIDCEIDISAAVLLCVKGVKVLADVITFCIGHDKGQVGIWNIIIMLVHPFQIKGNATCQRVQKICGVFGSILHFLRAILPTNAAAAENWITAQNLYGVPLMVFRYYSAVNAFARNPIVRFEPIRFYRFFQSGGRVSSGAVDSNSTRSTIFT